MDFMFFINALLRKKWVILICTVAGLAAAFLFTFTKKNTYLSAATYSTGFTMKQQVKLTADDGLNVFEIDQRFKNVIETFKSPVVIAMLSYDLMLHDLDAKLPFTTLNAKEKGKPEYTNVNLDKARQILLQKRASKEILKAYDADENKVYQLIQLYQYDNEAILDQLTVDRVAGTDFLNIIYKSENPEMSAYVVNTIGKEFISFFTNILSTRTEESAGRLDTLAAKKKKEIEDKTDKLVEYKKKSSSSASSTEKSAAALEMIKDVNAQLSVEQGKMNGLNADLRSVNQNLESLGGDNAPVTSNAELLDLQKKSRDLAVDFDHAVKGSPEAAAIQTQINDIQSKINKLPAGGASGGSSQSDRRKRKEDLLSQKITINNNIDAEKTTIAQLQSNLILYNKSVGYGGEDVIAAGMQAEIDRLNKEYESMTGQLQIAQNVTVAPEINFKQTLIGQPAIKPEHSRRKVIIGVGGIAALMLSSLWIIIMDFLDQSVRAPSVFNKTVNMKLLAVVNKIDLKQKAIDEYFTVTEETRADGDNIYIENLRKLRYEIEASGKKVILFTSTKPQEGKTTIIEALASSFSLARKKVLLIDTNFSNNSLTEKFEAKPLLDQFSLNGEGNGAEKLASINSNTKIPFVDIVGCKESAFSPEEVLQKNNLLQNLPKIGGAYDYILLEGASLNLHADTKELIKYADGVIVVFSAKSTIRQTDKDSIHFLKTQKDKLVGAVLNSVEKDNVDM